MDETLKEVHSQCVDLVIRLESLQHVHADLVRRHEISTKRLEKLRKQREKLARSGDWLVGFLLMASLIGVALSPPGPKQLCQLAFGILMVLAWVNRRSVSRAIIFGGLAELSSILFLFLIGWGPLGLTLGGFGIVVMIVLIKRRVEIARGPRSISKFMLLPRSIRNDLKCDLIDDEREMRESGRSTVAIRFHKIWQISLAYLSYYGSGLLKILGIVDLIRRVRH